MQEEAQIAVRMWWVRVRPQQSLQKFAQVLLPWRMGEQTEEGCSFVAGEFELPTVCIPQAEPSQQRNLEPGHRAP
jgi:hypothetical protein